MLRELRTLRVAGVHVYSVAGGMQVYSVAGGMQVYSVTNYSTCCFLLHLQLQCNLDYPDFDYPDTLSWSQCLGDSSKGYFTGMM